MTTTKLFEIKEDGLSYVNGVKVETYIDISYETQLKGISSTLYGILKDVLQKMSGDAHETGMIRLVNLPNSQNPEHKAIAENFLQVEDSAIFRISWDSPKRDKIYMSLPEILSNVETFLESRKNLSQAEYNLGLSNSMIGDVEVNTSTKINLEVLKALREKALKETSAE
jgi:hypothetical protein